MNSLSEAADGLLLSMRGFVTRSLEPVLVRIKLLEDRIPASGKDGRDGIDGTNGRDGVNGKSVDLEALRSLVELAVAAKWAEMPKPQDGVNGKDGANGRDGVAPTVDEVLEKMPSLEAIVELLVPLIPAPIPGPKGADGVNGKDGTNGRNGYDAPSLDDIVKAVVPLVPPGERGSDGADASEEMVELQVRRAFDAMPKPQDGAPGLNGKDADEEAIVARVIKAIPVPKDGADGASADEDAIVERVLKALPAPQKGADGKDGTSVDIERVRDMVKAEVAEIPRPENGRDGRDAKGTNGRDGVDGLSISDFEFEIDEARNVTVTLVRSDGSSIVKTGKMVGMLVDRGVYSTAQVYEKGDSITYGGSQFIATRDAPCKPATADGGWRLAVKAGQNGLDAYELAKRRGFTGTLDEFLNLEPT
jgi:hypothetical protein